MKNWNMPEVTELNVRLTASSGVPSTSEAGGFLGNNGWNNPTFDSALYEDNGDCVIAKKSITQS